MGIPSYFSYVLKNHTKIIKRLQEVKCNHLYIDANSLIYDVTHINTDSKGESENINEQVYQKIMALITKLKPEFTFVAFDGVAPLAKMKQQKQRRYKSWITKQIIPSKGWNTNAITPGTTFMNDLDKFLEYKFKTGPVLFSGTNKTGEGEHKITEYIRKNPFKGNQMIYGLDADLIMLGLLHLKYNSNIYLYRETCHFSYLKQIDLNQDYVFSMNEMASQIKDYASIENYCFLCFLFGNDFMPHFPSLNIRNNGIPYLLEIYKTLNKDIVIGNKIQWPVFKELCILLSQTEEERIHLNIKWKKNLRVHPLTQEEELNFLPIKDMKREDYLSLHLDKYYPFLFKQSEENPCKNYLKMLEWTWSYYNGECKDYYITYEFHHAPLFKSLLNYIPCFNEDLIEINNALPPLPIIQLIYVLPFADYSLVPIDTSNIVKKFPNLTETNFTIHYDFCKFFWESHVDFNYVNLSELNEYYINIK